MTTILRLLVRPKGDDIIGACQSASASIRKYAKDKLGIQSYGFLTNCYAFQESEDGPYNVQLSMPILQGDEYAVYHLRVVSESIEITITGFDDQTLAQLLTHLTFTKMGEHHAYIDDEYEPIAIKYLAAYAMVLSIGMDTTGFLDFSKENTSSEQPNFSTVD